MTFCVTCVVERIVTTHFRKPLEGCASSLSRFTGEDDGDKFSAFFNVSVDSNQNKQVIYAKSVYTTSSSKVVWQTNLGCKFRQTSPTVIYRGWNLQVGHNHVCVCTLLSLQAF